MDPEKYLKEIRVLKERLNEAGSMGIKLLTENEENRLKINELNATNLKYQREIAAQIQNGRKELSSTVAQHENTINDLQQDYEKKIKVLNRKIQNCSNCNPKLRQVNQDKVRLEQNKELEESQRKIQLLESEMKNLEIELKREKSNPSAALSEDLENAQQLRSDLSEMHLTVQHLTETNEQLSGEITKLSQDAVLTKELKDKLEQQQAQMQTMKEMIEKLKKTNADLKEELNEGQTQFTDVLQNCKRTSEILMDNLNQNYELVSKNKMLSNQIQELCHKLGVPIPT